MSKFESVAKHINARNVHRDKKSFEITTGKVKPKFKLAGNPIKDLGQFIFFILAGSSDAYHKALIVKVNENEWIERNSNQLHHIRETSYIDITRYELFTTREILYKILDKNNGFKYIAKLPENKLLELEKKRRKIKFLNKPVANEIQLLIKEALRIDIPETLENLRI